MFYVTWVTLTFDLNFDFANYFLMPRLVEELTALVLPEPIGTNKIYAAIFFCGISEINKYITLNQQTENMFICCDTRISFLKVHISVILYHRYASASQKTVDIYKSWISLHSLLVLHTLLKIHFYRVNIVRTYLY